MGRHAVHPGEASDFTYKTVGRVTRARVRWRDLEGGYHETRAEGSSKKVAKANLVDRLDAAMEAMRAEYAVVEENLMLSEVAASWLNSLTDNPHIRPSTVGQYRACWTSTLAREFGTKRINDLTRRQAQAILDEGLFRRDHDGEVILREGKPLLVKGSQPRAVLVMLLTYAADKGMRRDGSNVLAGTKRTKRDKPKPRALTREEWVRLYGMLVAKRVGSPTRGRVNRDLEDVLLTLYWTAARIGEVLALRICDVETLSSGLTVATLNGTITNPRDPKNPGLVRGPRKTGGEVKVTLPPEMVEMLEHRVEMLHALNGPDKDGNYFNRQKTGQDALFFQTVNGEPLWAPNLNTRLRNIVSDTDLSWVHPHSLRHTALTEMAERHGEQAAAEVAGHSDVTVTRRHYIEVRGEEVIDMASLRDDDGGVDGALVPVA